MGLIQETEETLQIYFKRVIVFMVLAHNGVFVGKKIQLEHKDACHLWLSP